MKVSLFDLTVDQVEAIELSIGFPLSRWAEVPSQASLYAKVAAAVNGDDEARYRSMTLRQLTDLVDIRGSDDPNP